MESTITRNSPIDVMNMTKKTQYLKEELDSVHTKLKEFSRDLSDFSNLPSSQFKANGRSDSDAKWSTVNMTTKMYQKSDDPNILPDRIYITRNSLLTELFKVNHIRTIRHIFISIMIIFALQVIVNDVAQKGKIDLNFHLIQWAFGNFTLVLYTWFYMKFFTACVVYCAFHYWSKSRISYLINYSKKNDDLKAKKLPINMYDLTWLLAFVAYLIGFTIAPGYVVIINRLPPASAMVILMEQLRLIMKTYAFVRSNIPRALENGDHYARNGGFDMIGHNSSSNQDVVIEECDQECQEKVVCPEFSKYLYFLFAPVLVYQDIYPRTLRTNWNVVLKNFAQVIGSLFYVNYIFVRFCIPVFQDFNKNHVTLESFARSILNCHLSGSLLLLIGFFAFLHCWLNAFSEMLCFGDRMFYQDWWNSTNFQTYYRTWNCVVHDFLYTYIYKDIHSLVGKRYKVISQFAIFFISAVFHEYVLTLALGFFYPVLFFMFGALGFVFMLMKPKINSDICNFFLWIALQLGLGGLMCLYSIEWYARQNCNQVFESKAWDYIIPRSFTCGMEYTYNTSAIHLDL